MSDAALGLEPETTLVIEIVGTVEKFVQAVEAAGLEWLGEWDREDIEPDDDFYNKNKKGEKTKTPLKSQMFLSMVNESGLQSLLGLWNRWEKGKDWPRGKTKWRDVFNRTKKIRRWGIEDAMKGTGIVENWRKCTSPDYRGEDIFCEIELFFRKDARKRKKVERALKQRLEESGGQIYGPSLEMPSIGLHAVKAKLSADSVSALLEKIDSSGGISSNMPPVDMPLFEFHGIMYFRPTGQSLTTMHGEAVASTSFPEGSPSLPPVVAILDGVPNQMHDALKNRIELYDPDDLSSQYSVGQRRHGTAMASLIIHGDASGAMFPLNRRVYCLPIMQYNKEAADKESHYPEYVPPEAFIEDRVERAVRHMLDEEGNGPSAPTIKIINFSIGIGSRPFERTPSPLAILLDWLSWKYQVLFCVSAGNYTDELELGLTYQEFSKLSEQEQVEHTLKIITKQLSERRLISPAESLNSVTVGALHADESGNDDKPGEQRFDLLPRNTLFSPLSRFGLGFRRAVKPEVLFPGGRQFYGAIDRHVNFSEALSKPGLCTAWDSSAAGDLSKTAYTRGTSNATALATRSAARIYDVLVVLQEGHKAWMPDNLMAVLIKALLVHGAKQSDEAKSAIKSILESQGKSRRLKELMSRYIGYGAVDIERVLSCTEQRATVIACGEIDAAHMHEYRFPLPRGLSGQQIWRRMIVTLAWFSPINPRRRNYRVAKLSVGPSVKWDQTLLNFSGTARVDSDSDQVKRGTIQHEILEGRKMIAAYAQGDNLILRVVCKPDAAEALESPIPYGLAVTLEVAEDVNIPIYSQIRDGIRLQVPVEASPES